MFLNIFSSFRAKINFHFGQLFAPEIWNIGMLNQPIQSLLKDGIDSSKIVWMPAPKNGEYSADPFATVKEDSVQVYFERYSYQNRKGKISSVTYQNHQWNKESNTVIDEEFHVSYPFILEYNGSFYCVPETSENNRLNIFEIDIENDTVRLHDTLLENINARDAVVFQHNGYWWIFCTVEDGPNSKMHIYYANELLGPYTPHQNNPVKDDYSSARSAGTPFYVGDDLYRPAQDCSEFYGKKITINKIVKLSPGEFEEAIVKTIEPISESTYNIGIHTISAAGEYTLIDGKRTSFVWSNFTFQLNRKVRKVLGISS